MPDRLSLLCTVLLLGACTTLGPDYREPDVAWLRDWQPDLYGEAGEPASVDDLGFWWSVFEEPALDALIATARQENLDMRIAGLRILESRAALGIADSARFPQLQQVNGAATYVDLEQHGGESLDRKQNLTSYQAAFNIGWELDFWGRFRRGIESADAAFFASIARQQDLQVLLSAQVADLYFAYRTTQLRIGIARKNAGIQQRSFEITERLFGSGQSSELDLQQARTQYLATLATIPELEIGLIRIRNAIAALLGRPPGELAELAAGRSELPAVAPQFVGELPARLVLRRPDVRAAAWQVAAQSAQIGIAEADFYPAISLFGTIGWSGDTLDATPDTRSLGVGPSLTWNVFDYGRIRNNVRLQDARLQQSIENFQNSVLQAAREIDDAAIGVVKTREQQSMLSESVSAAERSLELANRRYQEGYADFQRVLDAQRALFSQAERELVNRGNHISAVIDLYRAMGGGWLDMPLEEIVPAATRDTMRERSDWGDLLDAPLPTLSDRPLRGPGNTP
jgi:NodT family efflux transporter outer membrane factor (OMF) lipoprotein